MFLLLPMRRVGVPRALAAVAVALTLAAGTPTSAAAGTPAPAAAGVERHVLAGDRVSIHNLVGEFTVVPTTGPSVVAEITFRGPDANRLQIREGTLRGVNTLRVVYPGTRVVVAPETSGRGGHGWTRGNVYRSNLWVRDDGTLDGKSGEGRRVTLSNSGPGLTAAADVRLLVPRGRTVGIYWGHGRGDVTGVDASVAIDGASLEVTARDVKGTLGVDVGSGNVQISDASADLSVDTGSGDVTLADVRGDKLSIDTGSGGIDARGVEGQLVSLDTGSGDIRAEGIRAPRVHVDTGSGNVEIAIVSDVEALAVDSGSGNVQVEVPSGVGASLQVETGSGQIASELPLELTKRSRGYLAGTIGDGRGRIMLETGSGNVSLRRGR